MRFTSLPPWLTVLPALFFLLGTTVGAATAQPKPTTITFVANAENQTGLRVRYSGKAWKPDQGGFLLGQGRGQKLLADADLEGGDFRISFDLSLRFGRESTVLVDHDGELALVAGAKKWQLRGRFFRVEGKPIEVSAPVMKPDQGFNLVLERTGTSVTILVDGISVYRGLCSPAAVSQFGLNPALGEVRLYAFSAKGLFASGSNARAFDNPFGMQLRRAPKDVRAVVEPVLVSEAPTNEACVITRRDGTLEIYSITKPASDSVSVVRSRDGGLTWSESHVAFALPGQAYYAVQVLESRDGALHAVVHLLGQGPGGYRGRLYEVYYTQRGTDSASWSDPRRIVTGYVGSIRGFIEQQKNGRLILAVARAIPEREQAPQSGPDFGWNDVFVYFSDDQGTTWRQSPDQLTIELKTPNVTRYGAIEPAMLEMREGRVWMLVRDRGGRLWQSFSADGERWSPLEVSPFISSDSPATLLRLKNGKIILLTNACQNWTDPRSYAMGGREVLHAAVSADDGKTWRGFREIFHETKRVTGGDRGTAYATATENSAGQVVVVSGQGEGKRAVVIFAPEWLEATAVRDDLTAGAVSWTQYGDEGLGVETVDAGGRAIAVPLKSAGLCGALWNFPMAASGTLKFRLRVPPGATAVRFCLNDHFNRLDDQRAAEHAVYTLDWRPPVKGDPSRWQEVTLVWREADRKGGLEFSLAGQGTGKNVPAQRPAQFGVNYLRVEFRASTEQGQLLLADAAVQIER